jgi:hypothetical protein
MWGRPARREVSERAESRHPQLQEKSMFSHIRARRAAGLLAGCLGALLAAGSASAHPATFIGPFAPNPPAIATTVPANGDVNPYGIVTVPRRVGSLQAGDLMVAARSCASSC